MADEPIVRMVSAEDLRDGAKEIYEKFASMDKPVPKWMKVMANCEDILVGFFTMFKATMDDAPLPAVLKWKVAKVVSDMNKCEFCVDVANMQLKQFGLSDEDIARVLETTDLREQAAIAFAQGATEKAYEMDPATVANAKKLFSDEELVELTAVVGLFNYINRFNDALGVFPD